MIHKYCLNGLYIVLDVNSGTVHVVDKIVFDILDFIEIPLNDECYNRLKNSELMSKYSEKDICDAYDEIKKLIENGQLFSEDIYINFAKSEQNASLKAMCLHIAHDCNLRCEYCFASNGDFGEGRKLMTLEIGKKAIDFLIENSENRINLELDFFGGEPLMNFDVIKKIVEYARIQEKKYNKNFRFTITTNGLLLNDENISFINKEMSNVVLSLDGRKNINDKLRKRADKSGSYDAIVPKFKRLVEDRDYQNYYIRGTFTKYNLDFTEDIKHISSLGFDQLSIEPVVTDSSRPYALDYGDLPVIFNEYEKLADEMIRRYKNKKKFPNNGLESRECLEDKPFNFFHFMIDLEQGPCVFKRIKGCGCGNEYIAVTPDGDIYPCHQFVGMKDWKMGNVVCGEFDLTKKKVFSNTNVYTKDACKKCWAKFYCSGGCNANNLQYAGSLNDVHKFSCDIMKKRLECAIMIRAVEKGYED